MRQALGVFTWTAKRIVSDLLARKRLPEFTRDLRFIVGVSAEDAGPNLHVVAAGIQVGT